MSFQSKSLILLNAFSVNMLMEFPALVRIQRMTLEEARAEIVRGFTSAVGHASTAEIFSELLGVPIPYCRCDVTLLPGDRALLGQYRGPRLPEGITRLPPGATVDWFWITLE